MSEDYKLSIAIGRQAQAQSLLDNEMLQEAFSYLEGIFVDNWKKCEDPALRDELWRSQANLANLRKHLSTVIANGKLAQREIDLLARKSAA